MKKMLAVAAAVLLGIALAAPDGLAAGFRLPDQDAAAMGMAGAFAAQADNPSANWYNPAGITQLDGAQISAGAIAIYPIIRHENADGSLDVAQRQLFFPASLFFTDKLSDKIWLGFGLNSPFGLATDWYPESKTANIATLSRVETIQANPNLAVKMSDRVSLAVGLDYIKIKATMERMLGPTLPSAIFRLDGEGSGWGANAGVLYHGDSLNLGLSYRSRVRIQVDDAHASATGVPSPPFGATYLSDSAHTDITLPDEAQFGISYRVSDKLNLNGDIEYTWWSTYDRLDIQSGTLLALSGGATNTAVEEKDWHNVWAFRVGGQYKLSDAWKLRAGAVYDQNPVPSQRLDTSLPDSDRIGLTIGTGYAAGPVFADLSYEYLRFLTRHVTDSFASDETVHPELNGTYKSQAHLLAFTVGYKF